MPRPRSLGNPGVRDRPMRRLSATQRQLASDPNVISMANALAVKWSRRTGDPEDECRSLAGLAVVRAAGAFDPGRGVTFVTVAHEYIMLELRQVRRHLAPPGRKGWKESHETPPMLSLDAEFRGMPGSNRLLAAPPDAWANRWEDAEVLGNLTPILSGQAKRLVRRMARTGETATEAGRKDGLGGRQSAAVWNHATTRMRQRAVELDLWRKLGI